MEKYSHKFSVLLDYKRGNLTEAQAKQLLRVDSRTLKQAITTWGKRLPALVRYFDRLMVPTNTKTDQTIIKTDLAEAIDTTYRQINRLIDRHGIAVPKPKSVVTRVEKHANAQKQRTLTRKYAIAVVSGHLTAVDAAEAAGVSRRHIHRLVAEFCDLEGIVPRDLRHIPDYKREKMAARVEKLTIQENNNDKNTPDRSGRDRSRGAGVLQT